MDIEVKPSGQACGASITGVDLTKELSSGQIAQIRRAWLEHKVLSFSEQAMSDDDLERFTLYFGCFLTIIGLFELVNRLTFLFLIMSKLLIKLNLIFSLFLIILNNL